MSRQLVLIHGRAQEHKDSKALKAEWLDALGKGLAKSNLKLPIAESAVRFPFYGDSLFDMVDGKSDEEAADVVVRGTNADADEQEFTRKILEEIRQQAGITTDQIADVTNRGVVERGPLNWEWFQGVLRVIDLHVPGGSGTSIALFTHDVYCYLKNEAIRKKIEDGVKAAMTPGVPTVVVSHSLGTVVAYNLFRREGQNLGWKVPVFITVGSPLGIEQIRKTLKRFAPLRMPECAESWFNAMDQRDVVALYPLKPDRFAIDPALPAITNKTDVHNHTSNRHGIAGYLDDQEVAQKIFDAL
jgi:hypothetical protein